MNENMEKILKRFGLSSKETKICKVLFANKPLNITALAKKSGVKRTAVYPLLPSLLKNGLIQKKIIGKRFYYSMSNLNDIANDLITDGLQLKELAKQTKENEDNVDCQFLTDRNQVIKVMNDILKLEKGEIIYSIESPQSISSMKKSFVGTEKYWQRECSKKGIVLKGVGIKSSLKDILNWPSEVLKNMTERSASPRLLQDNQLPNFQISLIAHSDKTIIFSPNNCSAILIKNHSISDSFKNLIDFIYLHGDYVNLNEEIKAKLNL